MAAYCRVSTDEDDQLQSYENQVRHYTSEIEKNPEWVNVGIFADEGITGVMTKKRDEFNKMIDLCRAGKIDRILTKSTSRFARNTLDSLRYIRELKGLGISIKGCSFDICKKSPRQEPEAFRTLHAVSSITW